MVYTFLFEKPNLFQRKRSPYGLGVVHRVLLSWLEPRGGPGGRLKYKIERMHKDQGSENLGAAQAGIAEDNIVQTESDRDRHTATNTFEVRVFVP